MHYFDYRDSYNEFIGTRPKELKSTRSQSVFITWKLNFLWNSLCQGDCKDSYGRFTVWLISALNLLCADGCILLLRNEHKNMRTIRWLRGLLHFIYYRKLTWNIVHNVELQIYDEIINHKNTYLQEARLKHNNDLS